MKSEIEVVELRNVRQLKVALLAVCGRNQAHAARLLKYWGFGPSSIILATKMDGAFAGVVWIGKRGEKAAFYGKYDRRCRVTKVLDSEFEKCCADRRYAKVS